ISGSHLALARVVDTYLDLLDQTVRVHPDQLSLVVEGDGSKAYYETKLGSMLAHSAARIIRIVPHNSPWDLLISFGTPKSAILFIAFFLSTRTHLELSKIRRQLLEATVTAKQNTLVKARGKPGELSDPILSLEFGMMRTTTAPPTFRFRAYLPGN